MSWGEVTLPDVCEIQIGKTPARKDKRYWDKGVYPWASIADLSKDSSLKKTKEKISEIAVKETNIKQVPSGTVLMSYKLSIGKVGITSSDTFTNEAIAAFLIKDDSVLDRNFLAYALKNIDFDSLGDRAAKGRTLNKKSLALLKIPLPSLLEQKRIAAILDQADALRKHRQRALDHLNQLGQSIFYEMFGDRNLDGKWKYPETDLAIYCSKITDGTHQSPKWEDSGVPFLFSSNIRNQRISYETKKFISEDTYAELTKNSPVEKNDVLYTAVGSFGHSAVVDGKTKFLFQRHIAQLKPDFKKLNSTFLASFLESLAIKRHAERVAKGVAQKTVTLTEIKKFPLPAVPLETQQEFERRVSSLELTRKGMEAHLSQLNVCFASLQQRAFKGEL